jgi:hypothetical protein
VLTNKDFLAFVQSRVDHFDLMVRAGLMSATKATLKKAEAIKSRLPYVTGDTKLELLAMLRDLGGGKTPAEKTWTPQAKQRLAMAIIQANPGNVASLPAAVFKAAGASATMQNPWLQAFQQNLTNQVGAGVLTQAQADDALRPVLERTLPFLTGQDAADVRTKLFEISKASSSPAPTGTTAPTSSCRTSIPGSRRSAGSGSRGRLRRRPPSRRGALRQRRDDRPPADRPAGQHGRRAGEDRHARPGITGGREAGAWNDRGLDAGGLDQVPDGLHRRR